MKCIQCKYFKIICQPLGKYECGIARCEKHDLVVDWFSKQKLNKLVCKEKEGAE